MSEKKTFTVDKIKTDEICGLDGGSVTICGIDNTNFPVISGRYISGNNLFVSGDGDSLIDMHSGVFDELFVDGVKYVSRQQIAYAFRFGGPPISVPSKLPYVTGGTYINNYTGLRSGTNHIFVESPGSFEIGDHVLVGGLFDEDKVQETHTITGMSYYNPDHCCNAKVHADRTAGMNRIYYDNEQEVIEMGDVVQVAGSRNYEVTASYNSPPDIKYIEVLPALTANSLSGDCICLVQPTLHSSTNLSNNFIKGTKVANKFPALEGIGCIDEGDGDPYLTLTTLLINGEKTTVVDKYGATKTTLDHSPSVHTVNIHGNVTGPVYDDKTALLILSDDSDSSYLFKDATSNHTVTTQGSPSHSSTQKKFRDTSVFFQGDGSDALIINVGGKLALGDAFTIEFWFYPTETPTTRQTLLSKGTWNTDGVADYEITYESDNKISVYRLLDDNLTGVKSAHAFALNQWHHVAVVRTGLTDPTGVGNCKLWVNGALENSWRKTNAVHNSDRELFIGKQQGEPGIDGAADTFFKGYMDEIRISDKIIYTDPFLPASTQPTDSPVFPANPTTSLYFDGYEDCLSIADNNDFHLFDSDATIEFWWQYAADGDPTSDYNPAMPAYANPEGGYHYIEADAILTKGRWNQNAFNGWGLGITNDSIGSDNKLYEGGYLNLYVTSANGAVQNGWNEGSKAKYVTATNRVNDNLWHHIAVTHARDTKNFSLFVDGELQGSVVQPDNFYDTNDDLIIGASLVYDYSYPPAYAGQTGHFSNCYMDDIRITKGIRYESEFTPPVTKASNTSTVGYDNCKSTCYDTSHLYLERAMYANKNYDWHLTGYRESFVGFSGIKFNITGESTSGMLTMIYPNI
tara:strand:- start:780 stop:3350 length:2571 start_codon:yes stop_codon:yes gene_type:complete